MPNFGNNKVGTAASQCADNTRIAFGRGIDWLICCQQAMVEGAFKSASGAPCETKTTGMREEEDEDETADISNSRNNHGDQKNRPPQTK